MAQHAATINPWSPDARQHPHETYKLMRETQPVFRSVGPVSGNSFWFLTRYDDCQTALKDARLTKEANKVLGDEQMAALTVPGLDALNKHMLNFDAPNHTRLRGLVHKAFTPRMIDNLRPRIEEISASLLKDMKERSGETFDFGSCSEEVK